MMNATRGAVLLPCLVLWACQSGDSRPEAGQPNVEASAPGAETPTPDGRPRVGVAVLVRLEPTPGHHANGVLTLAETSVGVEIIGEVAGLSPRSEHGFHVHENGDCGGEGADNAGEHFDPNEEPHGDPRGGSHHLGDMLNLETDGHGVAPVAHEIVGATLTGDGPLSLLRRSIIVHADPDDYQSQPAGDAGDRIACGVIPAT
jgi:superoxide dismutase, Cu-Zn family